MLRRSFLKAAALLLAPAIPAAPPRSRAAASIAHSSISVSLLRTPGVLPRGGIETRGVIEFDRPYREIPPSEVVALLRPVMARHAPWHGWKRGGLQWSVPEAGGRVIKCRWVDAEAFA